MEAEQQLLNKESTAQEDISIGITKEQFERFKPIWSIWVATGKRHLLSELMNEPEEAWAVVLEMDRIYNILLQEEREKI